MFGKKPKDILGLDMFGAETAGNKFTATARDKEAILKDIEMFKKAKGHLLKASVEICELSKYLSDEKYQSNQKINDPLIPELDMIDAYGHFSMVDVSLLKVEELQKMITVQIRAYDQSIRLFEKGYEQATKGLSNDDETDFS